MTNDTDPQWSPDTTKQADSEATRTLTDAQCDFAKLLGQILAHRWQVEQGGKETADLSPE